MTEQADSIEYSEVREALANSLPQRAAIAACSIAAVFAVLLMDSSSYAARARVEIEPVALTETNRTHWSIEDIAIAAQSDPVLEMLSGKADLDQETVSNMRDRGLLRASERGGNRFIDLVAESRNADMAARLANAYAESMLEHLNSADPATASIAVAARPPTHRKIPLELGFAGAVAFSYLFGAALSIARYRLDSAGTTLPVGSRPIAEKLTPGISTLAIVPPLKSGNDMVTLTNPGGPYSDRFVTLRAGLEFATIDERAVILQVTSPNPAAGATTIAANLAVAMAQAGSTVAVVDGNLRRPRIHELFRLEQVPGLTSAILGRETLNTAARELRLDNGRLRVYPSGPTPPGPAELLGSKRAGEVFDALKRNFDAIIIDSPPVLPVADALVISRIADATLIVVNAKRTSRNELALAFAALQQAGAKVVGTVLNQAVGYASSAYGYGAGDYAYAAGPRLFRRDDPNFAPRSAWTKTLDRSELPKFEASRNGRRLEESEAAPAPKAAIGKSEVASESNKPATIAARDREGPSEPEWGEDITVL